MPFYATRRLKFGSQIVEAGAEAPVLGDRDYAKLVRRGHLSWSKETTPPPAVKPAEPIDTSAVVIPEDWRDLPWTPASKGEPCLRALAGNFGPVPNKDAAVALIEAELAKRAAAAPPPAVVIPEDWHALPEDQRIALAKAVTEQDLDIVAADAAIQDEVDKRAAGA